MRVQVPPRPLHIAAAYIVGVALGDGNISNPNGRATRLRITCDNRYPNIKMEIIEMLRKLFPRNSVSIVQRPKNCSDISIYSNTLEKLLPWTPGQGSKETQNAHIPEWVFVEKSCIKACLRGLLQTDGSVYRDRGYLMANFTNNIKLLAEQVFMMIQMLGFEPTFHEAFNQSGTKKYTVRVARNAEEFVKTINLVKA